MSAPVLPGHRYAECRCSHPKSDHEAEGLGAQCAHAACTCLAYRPKPPNMVRSAPPVRSAPVSAPPVRRAEAPAPSAPTIEQVLAAGQRSPAARTNALAKKIELEVKDLRERLADEREAAIAARARVELAEKLASEIADLEAQLAERRLALRARPKAPKKPCPTCKEPFVNLGAHRARAHGWRKP